jgi:hypothetical protein
MPDDHARDERIGAWLEVEPLDDVTRRRLVSTALAATSTAPTAIPSKRPSYAVRWIAAAASIVVILVVAVALLTAPGGNDEQQASTPPRSPAAEQKSAGAATGSAADSAAPQATALAPLDAGDFGDLDVPANLARLRTSLQAERSTSGAASAAGTTTGSFTELDALPCRDDLPSGTVTAVATGTLDGRRTVVVLTTLPDGNRSIDAVLSSPCEVRPLS